jgi:glyoxylase-like metal-dependent hydrolase (beta-lactamase superfamily II)
MQWRLAANDEVPSWHDRDEYLDRVGPRALLWAGELRAAHSWGWGSAAICMALRGRVIATSRGVPVELAHGDQVVVGQLSLEVVHLRGHTPGSVALVLTSSDGSVHAFTGDSLFPGGPGRTTTPATFTSLMDDLEARIFAPLPDETWIYPGHGKDSSLGIERPQLPEWRARGW